MCKSQSEVVAQLRHSAMCVVKPRGEKWHYHTKTNMILPSEYTFILSYCLYEKAEI